MGGFVLQSRPDRANAPHGSVLYTSVLYTSVLYASVLYAGERAAYPGSFGVKLIAAIPGPAVTYRETNRSAMDLYQLALRPLLFSGLLGDEETLHGRALGILGAAAQGRVQPWGGLVRSPLRARFTYRDARLSQTRWGLTFSNPIGLAAGFDKDGVAAPLWGDLGFGFAELGTVTQQAQPGNPQPRLFRLADDRAILNRMGFNNHGSEALAQRLQDFAEQLNAVSVSADSAVSADSLAGAASPASAALSAAPDAAAPGAAAPGAADRAASARPVSLADRPLPWSIPLGINLGKSKVTPLDQAIDDYCTSFRRLAAWGNYFVVNVSSPNTPGLRSLQATEALDPLLAALQQENRALHPEVATPYRPLFVKISPDLDWEALEAVLELADRHQLAGIIATNTTIRRDGLRTERLRATGAPVATEAGGISGAPLGQRSTEIVRFLWQKSQGQVPIIGVGGVADAAQAWAKLSAGACLVQLYTSWIYGGPGLVRQMLQGLGQRLDRLGMRDLQEAIGSQEPDPLLK